MITVGGAYLIEVDMDGERTQQLREAQGSGTRPLHSGYAMSAQIPTSSTSEINVAHRFRIAWSESTEMRYFAL